MKEENKTNNRKKYIDRWNSYIDGLYVICWTPSRELSNEIKTTIEKLKEFVPRVADDKGLKGGKNAK